MERVVFKQESKKAVKKLSQYYKNNVIWQMFQKEPYLIPMGLSVYSLNAAK